MSRAASIFDPTIIRAAATDSLRKLNPRVTLRNPVMAIVFVGAVLVTVVFFRDLASSSAAQNVFTGLVGAWLWFTVLFANFAEAMAEGRGKAQAASSAAHVQRRWRTADAPMGASRMFPAAPWPSATSAWSPPAR